MGTIKYAITMAVAALLLLAGCATSPEAETRRPAIESDTDSILSQPLDPAEFCKTKRSLADREYHGFRALDDKHILFEGRRDKMWINTLRSRCPDLRFGHVLRVNSFSWSRICDMDRFLVGDWFDWPWYRRWPWHWRSDWGMGMHCTLGQFQPVTEGQVAEIEAVLRSK